VYSAAYVSVFPFSLLQYMKTIHSILDNTDVSCQRRNMLQQTLVAILVLAVGCYFNVSLVKYARPKRIKVPGLP